MWCRRLKAETFNLRRSLAAGASARERGYAPTLMADEAGSQPAGTGGRLLRDSHPWLVVAHLHWPCAIHPNERAITCLRQELRIHKGTEQRITHITLQVPQPLSLGGGETQTRHLYEFTLNSLEYVI